MMAIQSKAVNDEFETAVVAELRQLRTREKLLQRMFQRMKTKPQLRSLFLQQLGEMQLRAQRLDAVLNPLGALRSPLRVAPALHTPAA